MARIAIPSMLLAFTATAALLHSVGGARHRAADIATASTHTRAVNPSSLTTPETIATVMAASHVPATTWTGQDKEDQHAYEHFFYGVRGGSYLELGAHNGVHLSNTKALHDFYGWRGVLVEANPVEYAHLTTNRPFDVTVHAAVCSSRGSVHYLSNDVVGGIWELMPQSFRDQWHPGVNPDTLPLVPCLPLMDILAAHNVSHINFFSLDVEGAELSVLNSMDFNNVSFDVIVIEADEHNEAKNAGVRKYLAGRGYRLQERVLRNDWFVRVGFKGSAKE